MELVGGLVFDLVIDTRLIGSWSPSLAEKASTVCRTAILLSFFNMTWVEWEKEISIWFHRYIFNPSSRARERNVWLSFCFVKNLWHEEFTFEIPFLQVCSRCSSRCWFSSCSSCVQRNKSIKERRKYYTFTQNIEFRWKTLRKPEAKHWLNINWMINRCCNSVINHPFSGKALCSLIFFFILHYLSIQFLSFFLFNSRLVHSV